MTQITSRILDDTWVTPLLIEDGLDGPIDPPLLAPPPIEDELPPDALLAPPPPSVPPIGDELPPYIDIHPDDIKPYPNPADILNGSDQLIESDNSWSFISGDFCTTPLDDFCLPTRPLQHWVCSQYDGGYNQNNVGHGNYSNSGRLLPAWKPVFDTPVRLSCSCSSRFITSDAALDTIIKG